VTRVLGVVSALDLERRWIAAPEPLCETSGVGADSAGAAARRLVDRGATALVSWGMAGGLDPSIDAGTVVLPELLIGADGSRIGVDPGWHGRVLAKIKDRVGVSTSVLLDVDRPISTVREKRELHRRTGAGAVDMESAAVASVSNHAGIPFVAVRVVVDAAATALPEGALGMFDEGGRLKRSSLVRIVLRPPEWPGIIALARANAAASLSMRSVWLAAEPDLGLS